MFCLNAATANASADPGFARGRDAALRGNADRGALRARSPDFVADPEGGLRSLLVDVQSHRGHELGSIGLVLPGRPAAAAAAMRAAIEERFRGDAMNRNARRR